MLALALLNSRAECARPPFETSDDRACEDALGVVVAMLLPLDGRLCEKRDGLCEIQMQLFGAVLQSRYVYNR